MAHWVHAAVSGDGRRVATTKNESSWIDVTSDGGQEPVARLARLGPVVSSIILTRDGCFLAAHEVLVPGRLVNGEPWQGVRVTRVCDVETRREIARLQVGPNEWDIPCLAFSPEGTRLAGRAQGGWLWVWNLESGESSRIPFKDGREFGLVFSPDSALLATSGPERTITLLDAETLQPRGKLFNHTGAVYGLDFAPDGRTLASASADGTVRLWNVATGQELLKLDGHTGPVRCVRFSHDGRTLASAAETPSGTSEVILWHTAMPAKEADPAPERTR
jgi:WD40 repeat protein